jgi:maltooligosyltrehalose synthase
MQDLSKYVSSGQAVAILRQEAGRPRASRQSLKKLVRLGLVTPIRVHTTCNLYDPRQVAAAARALVGKGGAE